MRPQDRQMDVSLTWNLGATPVPRKFTYHFLIYLKALFTAMLLIKVLKLVLRVHCHRCVMLSQQHLLNHCFSVESTGESNGDVCYNADSDSIVVCVVGMGTKIVQRIGGENGLKPL